MRLRTVIVMVVVGWLVACGQQSPTLPSGPQVPEVTVQSVSLSGLAPSAGSMLYSGQTLTAEVTFSFPRSEYPLQAGLVFWTIVPGQTWSDGTPRFGEGRGCLDVDYATYEPVKKVRCQFYLDPIIWSWWQRDGVKKVVLAFRVKNALHPGYGIGNELAYQEFDINYRVP